MSTERQEMILCAGMQSGGTSLISWCFLQRGDTNGVLDMDNSVIQTRFDAVRSRYLWVKMTIGSFRWLDVAGIYTDLGYRIKPLLVVRDPRFVYASLAGKYYGINGNTAEDPPLRMRFRRFLEDWVHFSENGWPILVFENFVNNPITELHALTDSLGVQWDDSMLAWGKPAAAISYVKGGNETFLDSVEQGENLEKALLRNTVEHPARALPESELNWLEETFSSFNRINGYPEHLADIWTSDISPPAPEYNPTRRKEWVDQYSDMKSRLDRIRRHALFGPLIRFWACCINRDYKVF